MTTADLRITGADVVLPDGVQRVDLLVRDGRIAEIVDPSSAHEAREIFDATGLHVLPGAIDPHVHLGPNITFPQSKEDVAAESQAAAAGGVTSMLAYLMSTDPYQDVFPVARDAMEADSVIDFGFHFCVVTRDQLESIPEYVNELGVSSYKFFMNFRGEEGAYLGLPGNDDGFLFDLLEMCAANGAMLDPHAENIELVWRLRAAGQQEGKTPLDSWNLARPDYVEADALNKLAFLGRVTGASTYAVHTSNALALDVLRQGRAANKNIFIETCPHYLTLDIDSPCGTYGKVNPPLRTVADQEALWEAVADGTVDTIGSDHVPRHRSFKEKDIWTASAGFPGLENILPMMLSAGYHDRGISLERIAEVTSTRPAQLFGLFPKKGVIAAGSDADLALVDLSEKWTVHGEQQLSAAAYSPWEDVELTGRVRHTFLRGEKVFSVGEQFDAPGGKFLERRRSGAAALENQR